MEYLLFSGTERIFGVKHNNVRSIIASVFCGIYCGACLLLNSAILMSFLCRTICLCFACIIAFGTSGKLLGKSLVFTVLNLACVGAAQFIPNNGFLAPVMVVGFTAIGDRIFPGIIGSHNKYITIDIDYSGKHVCLEAFRDTGNKLFDPVSGEGIVVIGPGASTALTGLTLNELLNPIETIRNRKIRGLRLIPYSSIGNGGDLMLGMRFHNAKINGNPASIVAGFAAEGIGDYEALIGGNHVF